jgi:hypothetical protein
MANQKFFAQKDYKGFPIPSTMMGFEKTPIAKNLVEVPAVTATGVTQVVHPNKLRYFVRVDKLGKIIPNSLFTSSESQGSGVIEFKLFKS